MQHNDSKKPLGAIALLLGIILSVAFTVADEPFSNYEFVNALDEALTLQNRTNSEDRVYMQFDKSMYQPGDEVWFSVFLLNGHDFSPSKRSDVVHVELIAPNGTAIKKAKIITKNGRASGDFSLDEAAPGGIYKIKTYTRWQQNEPSQFLFEKSLQVQDVNLPDLKMKMDFDRKGYSAGEDVQLRLVLVSNHEGPLAGQAYDVSVKLKQDVIYTQKGVTGATGKALIEFTLPDDAVIKDGLVNAEIVYNGITESISRALPQHKKDVSITFYPEGGDLVNDLSSKVAFKATDSKGKPSDVSGYICDMNTGDTITDFKSFHHGMGHFDVEPETGKRYYARISKPESVSQVFYLPNATQKNFTMSVTSVEADKVKLKVRSKKDEPAYIVLSVREKLYFADSLDLDKGTNFITIPTTDLPIGVARITLFNGQEFPVAERVVFASRDKQLNIDIETDKAEYLPREKVNATIKVTDENGAPVAASLALSVVDDKLLSFADDRSAHLLSKMLLEYDLRQKVEEPQIYFRRDKKSLKKLDYLMLTAGWRRFDWNHLMLGYEVLSGNTQHELSDSAAKSEMDAYVARNQELRTKFANQQLERMQKLKIYDLHINQLGFWGGSGNLGWNGNWNNNIIVNINNNFNNAIVWDNVALNGAFANNAVNNVNFAPQAFHTAAPVTGIGNLSNYNSGSNCHFVEANFVGMQTVDAQQFVLSDASQPDNEAGSVDFAMAQRGGARRGGGMQTVVRAVNNGGKMPVAAQEVLMKAREFETPQYTEEQIKASTSATRNDFRSTVYWDGQVEVDETGCAEISFHNNDDISSFRITAEGVSVDGLLGRSTTLFSTQIPLSVNARLPLQLTVDDTMRVPVVLANNTVQPLFGRLKINTPSALKLLNNVERNHTLAAGEKKVVWVELLGKKAKASSAFKIAFTSFTYSDAVEENIKVISQGIPVNKTFASNDLDNSYQLDLKAVERGSIKANFTVYPSLMADIMTGVESILREPNGCFEQTSATSYPNILAMQYMQESGQVNTEIQNKAAGMIDRGYKKLVNFETTSRGYEWFGAAPGHEGLTAYGLMQFNDMKSVYDGVDDGMIQRTRNWLLSKRDGRGGFKRNSHALHDFGHISDDVMNGYIVYAMTEAAETKIRREAVAANEKALKSNDPYLLAMSTIAMKNISETEKVKTTLNALLSSQLNDGSFKGKTHSITHSTGQSLTIETTALAAMAMMKSDKRHDLQLNQAIQFLTKSRSGSGGFGSTQATILALKALTQYTQYSKAIATNGKAVIFVDGINRGEIEFHEGDKNALEMSGLEAYIKADSKLRVQFIGTETALPYTISVDYTTSEMPKSSENCKVTVRSTLSDTEVKMGKTVRLSTTITNTTREGLPSTMCVIGIPGGFSVQPWQLKELQKSETFDYYELRENQLICYYRGMKPKQTRTINLDLKSEVPGSYTVPPSSGYLYYTNEYKDWTGGQTITIN